MGSRSAGRATFGWGARPHSRPQAVLAADFGCQSAQKTVGPRRNCPVRL